MYPKEIFLGLDLYSILLCVGIFVGILMFSTLSDKVYIKAKLQKFCFICAVFAILLGYGSSILFQSLYDMEKNGGFKLGGATFYGGLIGGAAVFLAIYFIGGHFIFRDGYHKRHFFRISSCAMTSVVAGHGIGRIGCLMAGCCHGKATDAWYGITMGGEKYVPVQLYEAIFLFVLCGIFMLLLLKKKTFMLPLYMVSYGVWRFFIEYARGDDRGQTLVSFLSPSQLTALCLIVAGIGLFVFEHYYVKKHKDEISEEIKEASDTSVTSNGEEN